MGIFSKWLESLDYSYEILPTCTRYSSHRSKCKKCGDSCPKEAIFFKKGIPTIEHSRCDQCGECLSACPIQAIAGIFPKRTITQNQLIISGEFTPTTKELLIYYKKGIRSILFTDESVYTQCEQVLLETNNTLDILNESNFTYEIKKIDPNTQSLSRRDLLSHWKNDTEQVMKEFTPAKWRFNQTDLDLPRHYPDYQFAEITLNSDKCVLCKACEKLCNKKCLTINEDHFLIDSQRCSACQLCQDICPEQAISVQEKISTHNHLQFKVYNKTCTKCNKSFQTMKDDETICFICTRRSDFLSGI